MAEEIDWNREFDEHNGTFHGSNMPGMADLLYPRDCAKNVRFFMSARMNNFMPKKYTPPPPEEIKKRCFKCAILEGRDGRKMTEFFERVGNDLESNSGCPVTLKSGDFQLLVTMQVKKCIHICAKSMIMFFQKSL